MQRNLQCIGLLLFLNIITTAAFSDAGEVKFINHSDETFLLKNVAKAKAATLIGLPTKIESDTDQNYEVSIADADAGQHYEYVSENGKQHFSIDVKSAPNYIFHHTAYQNVDYLSVNWENLLQNSDVHYVLPLSWQDNNTVDGQQVRVDSDNNAIIGIFSQKPANAITIMSYNTDKDATGTDHNPIYNKPSDIVNLFTTGLLPKPDVLMIQEGLGAQDSQAYLQSLTQMTPGKWYHYYATEGSRPDSNIIFIGPQYSADLMSSGTIYFKAQCGWGLVGKRNADYVDIPLSKILQTPIPGNLRIFDTHLESGEGADIFFHVAQVRFEQFSEILNYTRVNVAQLFVGGDLNTMPIFDDSTGLTKYKVGDLTSVFDKYLGDVNVNWGQPITCTWSTCTTYTFHFGMWLDRMFTSALQAPGYKVYVLYPYVGHQVDGHSDHLPVWVTLYYDKQ